MILGKLGFGQFNMKGYVAATKTTYANLVNSFVPKMTKIPETI